MSTAESIAEVPYFTQIRLYLQRMRDGGISFKAAWKAALEAYPPPIGYASTDVIEFARLVMRRAYLRIGSDPFPIEPPNAVTLPSRALALASQGKCRWGAGCESSPIPSGKFCEEHTARLRGISEAIKAEGGLRSFVYLDE